MTRQTDEEKARAIASLVWLLPGYYTMLKMDQRGRVRYRNEFEQPEEGEWRPVFITTFEIDGWPLSQVRRWLSYQRYLSAVHRLRVIGRVLRELEEAHPEQAAAVKSECIETPPPNWYEPYRVGPRCDEGLKFMAARISGTVPFFSIYAEIANRQRPKLSKIARNRRILEMRAEGISRRAVARELRCSLKTVKAVENGMRVLRGRLVGRD